MRMRREEADRLTVMALALIERDDGKVLATWEGDMPYHRCWVIPGGYVKLDEAVEQAVVREIREELSVEIALQEFIGVYDDFIKSESDEPVHYVLVVFKAKIVGGDLNVTREAMEYAWVDPRNVSKYAMPPVMKRILTNFSSRDKSFSLKRYNRGEALLRMR
jgi:ADP-ribose pyrophosphatase YjhB (NUDIX family)